MPNTQRGASERDQRSSPMRAEEDGNSKLRGFAFGSLTFNPPAMEKKNHPFGRKV